MQVASCTEWNLTSGTPRTLHHTPYTPHPTPYTQHTTPYTRHPAPCTLHPTPYTLHPTPWTVHPTPYTLHFDLNHRHPILWLPIPQIRFPKSKTSHPSHKTRNLKTETDICSPKLRLPHTTDHTPDPVPDTRDFSRNYLGAQTPTLRTRCIPDSDHQPLNHTRCNLSLSPTPYPPPYAHNSNYLGVKPYRT